MEYNKKNDDEDKVSAFRSVGVCVCTRACASRDGVCVVRPFVQTDKGMGFKLTLLSVSFSLSSCVCVFVWW